MENNLQTVPAIPENLFDKYDTRLVQYAGNKEKIDEFIKSNLQEGIDYGLTSKDAKNNTLMKSGSEKILNLMECKIRFYADTDSWQMLGSKPGVVCYVGYIIDMRLLQMIVSYLLQVGFEHEEKVIKMFAWGEGRGAYEIDELCYQQTGKPLRGSFNRALKMAEKRCEVDAVIRTFGLQFTQDEEYEKGGKLKGDIGAKPVTKTVNKKPSVPEENMVVYKSSLELLNKKEKNTPVFLDQEKIQHKKSLDAVVGRIEELNAFYQALLKIYQDKVAGVRATRGE